MSRWICVAVMRDHQDSVCQPRCRGEAEYNESEFLEVANRNSVKRVHNLCECLTGRA